LLLKFPHKLYRSLSISLYIRYNTSKEPAAARDRTQASASSVRSQPKTCFHNVIVQPSSGLSL